MLKYVLTIFNSKIYNIIRNVYFYLAISIVFLKITGLFNFWGFSEFLFSSFYGIFIILLFGFWNRFIIINESKSFISTQLYYGILFAIGVICLLYSLFSVILRNEQLIFNIVLLVLLFIFSLTNLLMLLIRKNKS